MSTLRNSVTFAVVFFASTGCALLEGAKFPYTPQCVEGNCEAGDCKLGWPKQADWETSRGYIGQCKDGLPNGKGVGNHTDPEGSVYSGEYQNGWEHGIGTKKYSNGRIYHGPWLEGYKHGIGKERNTDGSWVEVEYYEGEYVEDSARETTPPEGVDE